MSTKQILLLSESTIKARTPLEDNVSGKIILPAIRFAQEQGLREIIGSNLLDKLKDLVEAGTIEGDYRDLLQRCQDYLCYKALTEICTLTAVKISGAGLQQVSDERMNPISISDSYSVQSWYQNKADYCARLLQNYLVKNYTKFPELSTGQYLDIRSNLYSSATSGLFLGGRRGSRSNKYPRYHLNYDKPSY